MFFSDPTTPPIDEPCTLGSLSPQYILPPRSLVDIVNEGIDVPEILPEAVGRLIPLLRQAAQTHDPLEMLSRAAVASFAASQVPTRAPFINALPPSDLKMLAQLAIANPQLAPALADLSVTGRMAYANFRTLVPRESSLLKGVLGRVSGWPGATQDNVLFAIRESLDRAYQVARALRQQEARSIPQWVAVSGEDDAPIRPVNVPTAPYPQYDLTVTVKGIPVETRYMIASDTMRITPPPVVIPPPPPGGGTGLIDLPRSLPIDPQPSLPDGDVLLFIHGHSSRLEESLDLVPAIHRAGRQRGRAYIVIAMDLPCNGYSSMFDHTRVALSESSQYTPKERVVLTPILDFIEEFIIQFVDELDTQLHIKNRIVAVIGGSLGGNVGLRLGRRSEQWLKNIVAWSPASVWDSFGRATNNLIDATSENRFFDIAKYLAVTKSRERMNLDVPSDPSPPAQRQEPLERRHEFFSQAFHESHFGILEPGFRAQPELWYRDDWQPCKRLHIQEAYLEREEMYNQWFRRWHWRVALEQLIFSHRDPDAPGGRARYELIRVNMLLGSGEKDNLVPAKIWDNTRDLARLMKTPGRTLFLLGTGHSIHNERPQVLAQAIADFLPSGPTVFHSLREFLKAKGVQSVRAFHPSGSISLRALMGR